MAGRGVANNQATWRALLAATYFNTPGGACQICQAANKSCGNFFCVECKVGGVCETAFLNGGGHARHSPIQVWSVTRVLAVWHVDLRRFMPNTLVNQIQLYKQNDRPLCKFFKPDRANAPVVRLSRQRLCHGCGNSISPSTVRNRSATPVCSFECLLDHALAQRVNLLIAAIDSMPGEWGLVPANGN